MTMNKNDNKRVYEMNTNQSANNFYFSEQSCNKMGTMPKIKRRLPKIDLSLPQMSINSPLEENKTI